MSKRLGSAYCSGRSKQWVKVKIASGEGLERRKDVIPKPFNAIQGVQLAPGKGAARQPEASLAWAAATLVVKRRRQVLKPCGKPRDFYPSGPSVFLSRGQHRQDRYKARTCRLGRGLGAGQRHGMERQAT